MALFYRYGFEYNGLVKWFYAESEVDARKSFEKLFGTPAGDLIERKRW